MCGREAAEFVAFWASRVNVAQTHCTMIFALAFLIAAVLGGGIASVAGFWIGSILTPTLATKLGTKLAVAAVSIPHFVGTALRFTLIRRYVNEQVLVGFGLQVRWAAPCPLWELSRAACGNHA